MLEQVDSKTFAGLKNLWKRQLTCFPGVSNEKVRYLASNWQATGVGASSSLSRALLRVHL